MHLVEYVHVYWPDVNKLTNVGDDCLLKLKTYTTNKFWLDVFDSLSFVIKDSFEELNLHSLKYYHSQFGLILISKLIIIVYFFKKSYYKGMKMIFFLIKRVYFQWSRESFWENKTYTVLVLCNITVL